MIEAALIGAGSRGTFAYGEYASNHPNELRIVAVAEPDGAKRSRFSTDHHIPEKRQHTTWEELFAGPKFCDAIIISTTDRLHFEPALKALELGYHLLLEKPISPEPAEVLRLEEAAERAGTLFVVGHVLRYTSFFKRLKRLLDADAIGTPVTVQWNEYIGYWHYAHSYVRGNWRNTLQSSPILLAKCCHDIDLIHWLLGSDLDQVSSFGSLSYFTERNAPAGSTARCTDGCAVENDCSFSALKWYHNDKNTFIQKAISVEQTPGARLKAIQTGPYGRCVYRCDNDVIDHQVVNFQFTNGVTVAFTMSGLSYENTRTFKIMGTKGEIRGHLQKNELEITSFNGDREIIRPAGSDSGHSGGDDGIMNYFVGKIREIDAGGTPDSVKDAVKGHLSVFAAEHSRLTGKTVKLEQYVAELKRGLPALS